jgi:TonB family protein
MSWKLVTGLVVVVLALAAGGLAALKILADGPTPPPPAAAPDDRAAAITNPDWATLPNADDMSKYYPEVAGMKGLAGKATIRCVVKADGSLSGCVVESDSPRGVGFGNAALRMSGVFRMKPKTRDGAPVEGGKVRIPVVFRPPAGLGPPMDPAPTTGRFVYAGRSPMPRDGLQANLYVDLTLAGPAEGRKNVWVLFVLKHPQKYDKRPMSYAALWQAVDCGKRRMAEPPSQFFADDGARIGWSRPVEKLQPIPPGPGLRAVFDLACGVTKPGGVTFDTVAAARADSKTRFASAK